MPDFVLSAASLFVGVYGEVERPTATLEEIARSTEQRDQIGRYLAQTGVVLVSNVRGFGLLTCDRSCVRGPATSVPPVKRVLEKTVDLWSAVGAVPRGKVDANAVEVLGYEVPVRSRHSYVVSLLPASMAGGHCRRGNIDAFQGGPAP